MVRRASRIRTIHHFKSPVLPQVADVISFMGSVHNFAAVARGVKALQRAPKCSSRAAVKSKGRNPNLALPEPKQGRIMSGRIIQRKDNAIILPPHDSADISTNVFAEIKAILRNI